MVMLQHDQGTADTKGSHNKRSRHDKRHDRMVIKDFPHAEDFSGLLSSNKTTISDIEARENLSVLTYVISNGLNEDHAIEDDLVLLGRAMQRIPQDAVIRFFESYSLSLHAIWDRFMREPIPILSQGDRSRTEVRANIALYITTTLKLNPEWMVGHEDKLLVIASSLGNYDMVSKMLGIGARPSLCLSTRQSSIISALQVKAYDCIEIQVRSCDINEEILEVPVSIYGSETKLASHFVVFLDYAMECLQDRHGLGGIWEVVRYCERNSILKALAIFIENGADIDAPYLPALCFDFYYMGYSPDCPYQPPSCLEVVFYCCRALYEEMKPFSRRIHAHISRISVCSAAERGKKHLTDHLDGRGIQGSTDEQGFLQLVLFELVFAWADFFEDSSGDVVGASNGIVVHTLMDYGITLPTSNISPSGARFTPTEVLSDALNSLLFRSRGTERSGSVLYSLKHLFRQSGMLSPKILTESVDWAGTTTLIALAECNDHFSSVVREKGGSAIVRAALLGNYDAVAMLVKHGFDVNREFCIPDFDSPPRFRTAVGHVLFWGGAKAWSFRSRLAAVECLVSRGAWIRLHESDRSCFELLTELMLEEPQNASQFIQFLERHYRHEIFTDGRWKDMVLWLSNTQPRSVRPGVSQSFPEIFEAALKDDASMFGRLKPLAAVILWGGTRELIQGLIREGANVNATVATDSEAEGSRYSPLKAAVSVLDVELVLQLLKLGATTENFILGVAVGVDTPTREGERKKLAIMESLVDAGADVNDRSIDGLSALHCCAIVGNMDCASFLLQHGANPNAVWVIHGSDSSETRFDTPLDLAAEFGRLDIAQLFLMTGGLSATLGATGYDGAIERAEEEGFSAITKLIRTHISTFPAEELKKWLK